MSENKWFIMNDMPEKSISISKQSFSEAKEGAKVYVRRILPIIKQKTFFKLSFIFVLAGAFPVFAEEQSHRPTQILATDKAEGRPSSAEQSPLREGLKATVIVDIKAVARTYDRMIFGGFIEHFDNQIYGGVYEPASPLADDKGFRLDVVKALADLKVPVIRWPGGCFVDSYHWMKGVGKKRESHGDFRWGVIEPNTFGTDEFLELCRRVGAEPYICLNGNASVQENLDWVAYCNSVEGKFAMMRKENGHPEPYRVKFWSIGNERYDKHYINRVRETSVEMKRHYPDLKILCAGAQDGMKGVPKQLMDEAGDFLDYVSIHSYALDRGENLPVYDYLTAVSQSAKPEQLIESVIKSLRQKDAVGRIKVAYDEWNLRAWQHPGFPRNSVDNYSSQEVRQKVMKRQEDNDRADQYTIADGLFAASFLNACLRHSDSVTMANIAPLINTRGPLFVHSKGVIKRPHYHALWMYANLLKQNVSNVEVKSAPLLGTAVSTLDVIATVDASGKNWSLSFINLHPSENVDVDLRLSSISLKGTYKAKVLTGESTKSFNDITHPEEVCPKEVSQVFKNGVTSLPPHSLTILEVSLEN